MPTGQDRLNTLVNGRNLWGRAGRQLWAPLGGNGDPGTVGPSNGSQRDSFLWNDPRYFEQFTNPGSEGGGGDPNWRMNGATTAKFNRNGTRWTQLNNTSTGGTNEVMDPARVQWDDEFGAMTPAWNIRPDRRAEAQDYAVYVAGTSLMGGLAGAAASAGNAASGIPSWASTAMRSAPSLGRMALNSGGPPTTTTRGLKDMAMNNPNALTRYQQLPQSIGQGEDQPFDYETDANGNPLPGTGSQGNPQAQDNGGGGGLWPMIQQFGLGALGGYRGNQLNQRFGNDINRMIDVGTAGVTNNDRAGARNMVRGVYDGSISGQDVFNKVPGLRAISDRGYNDIARKMSAGGDADPQSSARMKEFADYNNELTSKAWNSEMDRASRIGGFNFDPSNMAGRGLQALATLDNNRRQESAGNLSLGNRMLDGLFGKNGLFGGGADGKGPLSGIMRLFQGNGISDDELNSLMRKVPGYENGVPEWNGLDSSGDSFNWNDAGGANADYWGTDNPYDIWGSGV